MVVYTIKVVQNWYTIKMLQNLFFLFFRTNPVTLNNCEPIFYSVLQLIKKYICTTFVHLQSYKLLKIS